MKRYFFKSCRFSDIDLWKLPLRAFGSAMQDLASKIEERVELSVYSFLASDWIYFREFKSFLNLFLVRNDTIVVSDQYVANCAAHSYRCQHETEAECSVCLLQKAD